MSVTWTELVLPPPHKSAERKTALGKQQWYRRHWQVSAFLALFLLQIKQANNSSSAESSSDKQTPWQVGCSRARCFLVQHHFIIIKHRSSTVDFFFFLPKVLLLLWNENGQQPAKTTGGKKTPMFSLEKGIYMLGGSTDEATNVKVELKRPWRGKLMSSSSSKEIHKP